MTRCSSCNDLVEADHNFEACRLRAEAERLRAALEAIVALDWVAPSDYRGEPPIQAACAYGATQVLDTVRSMAIAALSGSAPVPELVRPTDTERLDWLIEQRGGVSIDDYHRRATRVEGDPTPKGSVAVWAGADVWTGLTIREAIDAAMAGAPAGAETGEGGK